MYNRYKQETQDLNRIAIRGIARHRIYRKDAANSSINLID